MTERRQERRGTAAQWTAADPVLAAGELGIELAVTPGDPSQVKVGDGVTAWTDLPYLTASTEDTGWVDFSQIQYPIPGVTNTLPNDKGLGQITLRRIGSAVWCGRNGGVGYVQANDALFAPAGSWPIGFRPDSPAPLTVLLTDDGRFFLDQDGSWQVNGGPTYDLDDTLFPMTSWTTSDAFPA